MCRISAQSRLTLHEVAETLGVHYMTAYKYVRTGRLPASRVGHEWRVRRSDLERFRRSATAPPRRGSTRDLATRLRARLLVGDETGAWSLLDAALASGVDPTDVLVDAIAPAMRRIGRDWESGSIDVADEHRASAIAHRLVARLGARHPRRGRRRGSVVIAAPTGDRHALAVALAADALRQAGYLVVEVGADLPPASFAAAVERARDEPNLLAFVLTVTMPGLDARVRRSIAAVRAVAPDLPVVVGGAGASGLVAARIGADAVVVGTARDLVAWLDRAGSTDGDPTASADAAV